MSSATFAMRSNLRVQVQADQPDVMHHFDAEYGISAIPTDERVNQLTVTFAPVAQPTIAGGHKTVKWGVFLDPPGDGPLSATIDLRGRPRAFGLSLVQGYFAAPAVGGKGEKKKKMENSSLRV